MKTPAPNMTNDNKTVINLDDARILKRMAARLNMRVEHLTFSPQPALVCVDELSDFS